jgi:hypothetical protein
MSRPENRENLQSLADQLVWAIQEYQTQWVQQPDAVLVQPGAVQNTWYTVLPATGAGVYTNITDIFFQITVANETLEVEVTIDGITKTGSIAAVFGTDYQVRHSTATAPANTFTPVPVLTYSLLNYMGHNVRVRVRKTTNNGAGSLNAKVIYAIV